ncbi:hypothetical protein GO755_19280 [Spirosoma sp. HMF4905]|uniref:Uncharacterized protein n=1 Tax=Spirosoma arboris TaxID=2682092 RepID=A0A7K1SEH0_9BACT|nr:hypothetical protein [Spirosoma arboris]MVM32199.1 hypothetical protein [Spirosoma arboris]
MDNQINIDLLKEYIKTLIASEVVFPGTLPRQWGKEFTKAELEDVNIGLKMILRIADPITDKALIREFKRVDESGAYIHWFLYNNWRKIVQLMADYPYLATRTKLPTAPNLSKQ